MQLLPGGEKVFLLTDSIHRKVMLYDCGSNMATVVDYMRKLRGLPYELVVPVYPEENDMLLIQGEEVGDVWYGKVVSINRERKELDVSHTIPKVENNVGIFSHTIPKVENNMGIFSLTIPKVENNMRIFSQTIPKIENNMGIFSHTIPKVENNMGIFSHSIPKVENTKGTISHNIHKVENKIGIFPIPFPWLI